MDNTDTNQKLTSNSLRGASGAHYHPVNNATSNNTSNTNNTNMSGGKKRKSHKHKSHKHKSHKHKSHKMTRKTSHKRSTKKGGSYGAIFKEAIVPFGLFTFLKKKQNKHHGKRTFRKNKTSKKR